MEEGSPGGASSATINAWISKLKLSKTAKAEFTKSLKTVNQSLKDLDNAVVSTLPDTAAKFGLLAYALLKIILAAWALRERLDAGECVRTEVLAAFGFLASTLLQVAIDEPSVWSVRVFFACVLRCLLLRCVVQGSSSARLQRHGGSDLLSLLTQTNRAG